MAPHCLQRSPLNMKLPLLPLNRFGYFTSFLAPQEVLNVSSWWFSIRSHEAYLALNFWSHQHDVVAWKSLRDKQSPIIAFVQNPFWILEGPNVILMMAPLSNIAFTFSPFRAALSWAGRKIKHRGSAISLCIISGGKPFLALCSFIGGHLLRAPKTRAALLICAPGNLHLQYLETIPHVLHW